MSNGKYLRASAVIAIALTAFLTGCGSNPNTVNTAAGLTYNAGGCISIEGQIPFTGTNVAFDGAWLRAGVVPNTGMSYGNMVIGGAVTGGKYQGSGPSGQISMNVVPLQTAQTGYYQTGYGTSANMTGYLVLSEAVKQSIRLMFTSGTAPCVSRVALDGYFYDRSRILAMSFCEPRSW